MSVQVIRSSDLDLHLEPLLGSNAVTISAAIRNPEFQPTQLIPLLELGPRRGLTIKILAPDSLVEGSDRSQMPTGKKPFQASELAEEWWGVLRAVLVSTGACQPKADPVVLANVLYEKKRIRLICDTNSLAGGTAAWLLAARWNRADLIVSSVVDRELLGWTDRIEDRWQATTLEGLKQRANYRQAFSFLETTPDGVVVDRMAAPEQSALMLSKVGDSKGKKSPDADMLLIEHARGLIRDQARNARTVYLTGDLASARAAVNALGADNVLYMVADTSLSRATQGKTIPWGWWQPGGVYGQAIVPSLARLARSILAAFDLLVFDLAGYTIYIRHVFSLIPGCPSDWADPHYEMFVEPKAMAPQPHTPPQEVEPAAETQQTDTPPEPPLKGAKTKENDSNQESAADPTEREAETVAVPEISDLFEELSPKHTRRPSSRSHAVPDNIRNAWLLRPLPVLRALDITRGNRLNPRSTLTLLARAFGFQILPEEQASSSELIDEAAKVLVLLGAIDEDGLPGKYAGSWFEAWITDDLDWFHQQFLRHPGYRDAIMVIKSDPGAKLPKRESANIGMARALGQVAIHPKFGRVIGESPVDLETMVSALNRWLPSPGDSIRIDQASVLAASELGLTPYRFDLAMQAMWRIWRNCPYSPEAGGTGDLKYIDKVVSLGRTGFQYQPVSWSALSFGTDKAFRFLRRVS